MLEPESAELALQRGLEQIREKAQGHALLRRYYAGDHPRVWLTDRLRDMFQNDQGFADAIGIENWCRIAVDTPVRRLSVKGFVSGEDVETMRAELEAARDEELAANPLPPKVNPVTGEETPADPPEVEMPPTEGDKALEQWDALGLDREEHDLYADVLTVGEAYLIATNGEDGLEVDLQQPELMAWGPQRRATMPPTWAVKAWADEDEGRWRATVYDDTRTWRFVGPRLDRNAWGKPLHGGYSLPDASRFELDPEDAGAPHGFKRVPVQRFDLGRHSQSIIETIRYPQDRLNKLTASKMVAAEFGAYRQRWILTRQAMDEDALDTGPDKALIFDPGSGGPDAAPPTSIGEFGFTPLGNYDGAIGIERDTIFSLSSLPRHMNVAKSGAGTSGDAFAAAEGPFNEFVRSLQRCLGARWADFFELIGYDVEPDWVPAETHDTAGETTAVKTLVDAGVPLELALKNVAGWTPEQLAELTEAQEAASEKNQFNDQMAKLRALGEAGSLGALDEDTVKATAHGVMGIQPPAKKA